MRVSSWSQNCTPERLSSWTTSRRPRMSPLPKPCAKPDAGSSSRRKSAGTASKLQAMSQVKDQMLQHLTGLISGGWINNHATPFKPGHAAGADHFES